MAFGVLGTNDYFEIFIKSRFPQRKIENLVAYDNPFMEVVKKSDELTGDVTYLPIQIDSPQGLGSTLDVANTSATSGTSTVGGGSVYGVRVGITRAKYYAVLTLDAETMLQMRNDEGGFFRARERNVTEIMEQLGQHLEMACWGKGTGTIGTVTSDPGTGTTFTLEKTADSIKFHLGMRIQFYSDEAGTARSGGPYTVTKVNEDTGVVTVSAALDASILSTGSRDFVARVGDAAALLKGVPAWIPETAASSANDLFSNFDRTVAVQKLQGHRQTWLGSIEETVKALDAKVRRVNKAKKPKTLWVSYSNFNRLDLELGARGMRVEDGEQGKFGRPSLMMTTPGGGVVVKAGPYVPETAAWLLDMDSWSLKTLGPAPHLVQDDGNVALRLPASTASNGGDGIEIRWRYFAQLVCDHPYVNGVAAIS